jgi:ATPase subunit of ABC transporter with duplicated ATPase domains
VLLLDEPTNHLDGTARDAVRRLLAGWRGALLVASHDRKLLAHVDRILELSPNGARWYGGAIDTYEAVRAAEQDAALAALHHAERTRDQARAQAQADRESRDRREGSGRRRADRRGASAIERSGAKERATGTQSRLAEGAERRARELAAQVSEAKARVEERVPIAFTIPSAELHGAQRLVSVHEAGVSFDGVPALSPITLEIGARDRIGVTGPNGSGKSTLLALLAGALPATTGEVRHHVPPHRIARLSQDAWRVPDAPSLHAALSRAWPDLPATEARTWLAAFGFRGARAERGVQGLSGGERLRLSIACAIDPLSPPGLLLLDEPTNHLDLDAVQALEQALRDYAGALVVVSHDRRFLEAIELTQWVVCARSDVLPDAGDDATTRRPPPR